MIQDSTLSHFYIIEGNSDTSDKIRSDLENLHGIVFGTNPDVQEFMYESFGIDESRALKDFFSTRSLSSGKKIAIVSVDRITREAQNALLKLSEEPAQGQHLILIVPSLGLLIDTLKSRAQLISSVVKAQEEDFDFLTLPIAKRLALVGKIIAKKDRQAASDFIDQVIVALKKKKNNQTILTQVYMCRSYIQDQSASIKLILEHISLILGS